jgi:hypothetical protein
MPANHTTQSALIALGFTLAEDGALLTSDATIALAPVGRFYQLMIRLPGGSVAAVVTDVALKITCEPSACDDDGADMLDDFARRGANDDESGRR